MFNYLIKIEYDGTNFVGWQSQKNGKSIQDSIETALKKVLRYKVRIIGAGRTDKGVHALSQFANFKNTNQRWISGSGDSNHSNCNSHASPDGLLRQPQHQPPVPR